MSEVRTPFVGEIVLFTPNPGDTVAQSNYNTGEIAAIVTRVWSHGCVNLKIIPDCGAMQDRTSVVHQSLNYAGYSFRFQDEKKIRSTLDLPLPNSSDGSETKDASSFLTEAEGSNS